MPLVYVVILNYNGMRWIKECLSHLLETDYGNYRVLLVDNASDDGSVELARQFLGVQIIINRKNSGFSEGNNSGIRVALDNKADYVVLLNPDTKVEQDWLAHLIEVGEAERSLGILGSVQLEYSGDGFNSWTTSAGTTHLSELSEPETARNWIEMDWVEGSCFAIKRQVLESVGLLDPIYSSFYEEIDLCRRASYHGYKIALVPRSRIHHYRGGSWTASESAKRERDYRCDRSQFIYASTDPGRSLFSNLRWYFVTLGTKLKSLLDNFNLNNLLSLMRIQVSLLLSAGSILGKWRRDRMLLSEK